MSLSQENKVIIDGGTFYGGLNQPNLKFVKVNVDCWEKVFDYLSLEDILAMSATCLRMRQIGGHYFRENFHGTKCIFSRNKENPCFAVSNTFVNGRSVQAKREDFIRFADTVEIGLTYDDTADEYQLDRLEQYGVENSLASLTTLHLHGIFPSKIKLPRLTNVLNNVEHLELNFGMIYTQDDCFGQFLASFPKLRKLQLLGVDFRNVNVTHNSVFQHVYPKLADFQCTGCFRSDPLLTQFLELNPSIKTFRIGINDLWEIQSDWTETIQLDYLNIFIGEMYVIWNEFVERIRVLHANGNFKTLHLNVCYDNDYSDGPDEQFFHEVTSIVNEMASFGALEVLYTAHFITNIHLLTQLKELQFGLLDDTIDLKPVAENLKNLERLWIDCTIDQLLPFLRHSKKLKMVIFKDGTRCGDALNVHKLSEVRDESGAKQKVKIGVCEDIYLATKWKTTCVCCDLIEITRIETIREQFLL